MFLPFHLSAALYPFQSSLSFKMEKPKSLGLMVESSVQIAILSTLNTAKTIFRDKIFLEEMPLLLSGEVYVTVKMAEEICRKGKQHNKSSIKMYFVDGQK